ncbi:MAG TPA: response regulator [Myxococcales bacterium]|nr:response regulator [Myxococcales bacterium]
MDTRSARILVVDDDHKVAQSVARALRSEGYPVAVAYDGTQALDEIARFNPDLILLDLIMPKLDGFGVLARLHTMKKPPPVIVVSAVGWRPPEFNGVISVIRKPFELSQLLATIARVIEPVARSAP